MTEKIRTKFKVKDIEVIKNTEILDKSNKEDIVRIIKANMIS